MQDVNWTALIVFVVLFGFITWLGFAAAHWRKGDLDQLHEWGLGGRRFGTVVTWFLVGGDLYTAYTFIAVPALAFGAGAVAFFAVPYTILIYPILFLVFPRLWHVCHKHGYITAAISCAAASAIAGSRWRSPSPASSRPCPISRCSWSAFRSSSARWASRAPASPPICRSSSPLSSLPPSPIRAACARRRRSPSSRTF